ncbi:MAG: peptidylprolyl isomerase [Clostridia bacterium]|nr:peptidylprolyl isomerase [Clostridia bacterium]
MAMPEKGETIAIMHVKGYGDIKFKFFKDVAPKAVENFLTHAKNGYYNGLTFHRVINEFMIQGGDPTGIGTGGESIWGEGFGTELDESIVPYRGSLCMAMSSLPNSIGSQFFITQAHFNQERESYFKAYGLDDGLWETYKKYGGDILSLYMKYTVFGQVIEGMDVVDKIAAVKTGANDKPVEDVIIESIDVTEY